MRTQIQFSRESLNIIFLVRGEPTVFTKSAPEVPKKNKTEFFSAFKKTSHFLSQASILIWQLKLLAQIRCVTTIREESSIISIDTNINHNIRRIINL